MGSGSQKGHEAITLSPAAPLYTSAETGDYLDVEVCSNCGAPLDDGEGWDGLCGNCADAADLENEANAHDDGSVVDALNEAATTEPPAADDELPDHEDDAGGETPEPADDEPTVDVASPPDWGDVDATEIVTPIPAVLPVGDPSGVPLIVGGDDIDDQSLTLMSFQSGESSREVLYGWINPDAEDKILAALALSEEELEAVEVTKKVNGRLAIDEDNSLHEQLEKVAKSVNHHQKNGSEIPSHTVEDTATLKAKLEELSDKASPDEQKALDAYLQGVALVEERMAPGYDVPYDCGGKLPMLEAVLVDAEVTVTEMVPKPTESGTGLKATLRNVTRIKPALSDGVASWDGKSRYTGETGKEYRIDLGDGFAAVYRPHADVDHLASKGHRGFLEVVAPEGGGRGEELVSRLGQLHLVNRPMTHQEAEWTYLKRNIWAQQLDNDPDIAAAVSAAGDLDDTLTELLVADRAHEAAELTDGAALASLAKEIRLEAEAKALPQKTRMVTQALAPKLGFSSASELRASLGYNPTPTKSRGWHSWTRFDVAKDPAALDKKFGKKVLYHSVTGNNLVEMFQVSGSLVATERRRVMGVSAGKGMSEAADMGTGGSKVVDLRVGSASHSGPKLIWSKPSRLPGRADWYAYSGDNYAAEDKASQVRSPFKVAGFNGGSNEVLFRNGIDLLGAHAPDKIICASQKEKASLLDTLKAQGVTDIGGRPPTEVITA